MEWCTLGGTWAVTVQQLKEDITAEFVCPLILQFLFPQDGKLVRCVSGEVVRRVGQYISAYTKGSDSKRKHADRTEQHKKKAWQP